MKTNTPLTDEAAFLGLVKASFARDLEGKLNSLQREHYHCLVIVQNHYREIEQLKAQAESNVKMRSDQLSDERNPDPPRYEYPMKPK